MVADLFLGLTAGTGLRFVAAGCAAGAGLFGLPNQAAGAVFAAGLDVVLVGTASGSCGALLRGAAFVNAGPVVADFVGACAGFLLGTPNRAAILVFFTHDVLAGCYGVLALALDLTDCAGHAGAVLAGFPTFTRSPLSGAFALLGSFDTDLDVGRCTTLNVTRFALSAAFEGADAEWFVRALTVLVFQTLHAAACADVAIAVATVFVCATHTYVFVGAPVGWC